MSDRLPVDIQRLVLDKVSSPRDHARFSCVCKLWYSVYKARKFSWLVLTDHGSKKQTCQFFSVHDQKIYRFSAPQLEGKHICGSSHGWLVTFDNEHALGLYEPFSKTFIQLPISPFKKQHIKKCNHPRIRKVILSCNPRTNPNECTIMLSDYDENLAHYKLGDNSWTPMPTLPTLPTMTVNLDRFKDIVFCKGNFVILCHSQVYVCHIGPEPHFSPFGPKMPEMKYWPYLVNLDGDVVIVDMYFPYTAEHISERHYDVYRLDKEMGSWKMENEIGDRVIFLGYDESTSLSTCLVPNSNANTIYGEEGIYYLKRRKGIKVYPRDVVDHLKSSSPSWLIQN